jgi:hypothetical protein
MADPCTIAVVALAGTNVIIGVANNGSTMAQRTRNWYREKKYDTVNINKRDNLHLYCNISKRIDPFCRTLQNRTLVTIAYPWNSLAGENKNENKGSPRETNKIFWGPTSNAEIPIQVGEHKGNTIHLFAYSLDGKHIDGFQIFYHSTKRHVFDFFLGAVLDDINMSPEDIARILPNRPNNLLPPQLPWYVRLWRWIGKFIHEHTFFRR